MKKNDCRTNLALTADNTDVIADDRHKNLNRVGK